MGNPEALHDIASKPNTAVSAIKNNNVAQAPVVSEDQMTKSQIGGNATQTLRSLIGWENISDSGMSGNLMAK